VFGIWVLGYSWLAGTASATDPANIDTVLGMPGWVFWGVALPWVAANVLTFWFCFRFMVDDPLDTVQDEQPVPKATSPGESHD
jgi:hypothetical protein